MAIARAMAGGLLERQTGRTAVRADMFWAYRGRFQSRRFSRNLRLSRSAGCDGVKCGNFLFVLEGDSYREVLGDIPGARLVPQDKVGLSAFKRNGYFDIQPDQMTIGWNGERYADISTLPTTSLNGDAFIAACENRKTSEQPEEGEAERAASDCQCQFNRFQAIGFSQADLDLYAASLGKNFVYPSGDKEDAWQAVSGNA